MLQAIEKAGLSSHMIGGARLVVALVTILLIVGAWLIYLLAKYTTVLFVEYIGLLKSRLRRGTFKNG